MPHAVAIPLVAELGASISAAIRDADEELRALSLSIHSKPELAWEEHYAHDILTAYMARQPGFLVTRHAYNLPTAWTATYGSTGPLIGFNSEMDALRGIGHACGHNLIAIAGCAAAIGVARALHDHHLPGRVVLLGTPAEEAGGGKCLLLERGAYDEMDACLMVHPGSRGNGASVMASSCVAGITVEYSGRSAHAGGAPEKGINALDAAVLGYSNVSVLRQQLPSSARVHGIITGGENWSANAIPASSKLAFGVRAPSAQELALLVPRVLACFSAAALATGCTYTVKREILYLDLRSPKGLAGAFKEFAEEKWGAEGYEVPEGTRIGGSTDFGNVSYHLPALHPMFMLPQASADEFPHSDTYTSAAATASAHEATLRAAEAIAVVGLKVLMDEKFRCQIRKEWDADMAAVGGKAVAGQLEQVLPFSEGPLKGSFCSCSNK